MLTVVAYTDEEEMGLESNIYVLRSDAATFPSGTYGHPWRAEAHCDFGGIYLLFLLVAFEELFGKCGMLLLVIPKLEI